MPNRIIREGWLESERINTLDAAEERFFLRLCLRADDYGRYHANPVLLRSNLFPLRDDIRGTDIPRWLAACESAGLLRCYEVSGKRYLEIPRFEQRTRAQRSKFPAPDGTAPSVSPMADNCQASDGHPRTDTESEADSKTEGRATPSCAEASPPPARESEGELPLDLPAPPNIDDPVLVVFPVVGAPGHWDLRQSKLDEYRQTFPGIDAEAACREARQWCVDNATQRKTAKGMPKFLFGWLERRQNRGGGGSGGPPARRASWAS